MQVKTGIYSIKSPSGKIYIGQARNITKRWYYYKSLACKRQIKLYNSFKKYGVDKHVFDIVEECSIINLDCRERHWQDFYNSSSRRGLNLRLTECNNKKQEPSKEVIEKIRKSSIKKWEGKTKKIYQYSLDGVLIKTWPSARHVKEGFGLTVNHLRGVIKRTCPKLYNYLWSYKVLKFDKAVIKEAKITQGDKMRNHTEMYTSKMKKVVQLDKTENIIKEWNSIKEAALKIGVRATNITACCKGKIKTTGKFKWEYINEEVYNKLNN